jgi:hypothetical protein
MRKTLSPKRKSEDVWVNMLGLLVSLRQIILLNPLMIAKHFMIGVMKQSISITERGNVMERAFTMKVSVPDNVDENQVYDTIKEMLSVYDINVIEIIPINEEAT